MLEHNGRWLGAPNRDAPLSLMGARAWSHSPALRCLSAEGRGAISSNYAYYDQPAPTEQREIQAVCVRIKILWFLYSNSPGYLMACISLSSHAKHEPSTLLRRRKQDITFNDMSSDPVDDPRKSEDYELISNGDVGSDTDQTLNNGSNAVKGKKLLMIQ